MKRVQHAQRIVPLADSQLQSGKRSHETGDQLVTQQQNHLTNREYGKCAGNRVADVYKVR